MARKNPIGKITNKATKSLSDPAGAAAKVAKHAKGAAALGRSTAGRVGRAAMKTAGAAASRRKPAARGAARAPRAETPPSPLRAVPSEPAPDGEPSPHGDPLDATTKKASAKKATPADVAQKAAKKATARKTAAKKATAKKTAAKKATAKKVTSPGDKLPPKKKAAKNPE